MKKLVASAIGKHTDEKGKHVISTLTHHIKISVSAFPFFSFSKSRPSWSAHRGAPTHREVPISRGAHLSKNILSKLKTIFKTRRRARRDLQNHISLLTICKVHMILYMLSVFEKRLRRLIIANNKLPKTLNSCEESADDPRLYGPRIEPFLSDAGEVRVQHLGLRDGAVRPMNFPRSHWWF